METQLTCATKNKHCVSIKKERQVKTKTELTRKLFEYMQRDRCCFPQRKITPRNHTHNLFWLCP